MIVGYQPGGTIKDARVVLRTNELLPNSFNVIGTAVYRETTDDPRVWTIVKTKDAILPPDSPLLSTREEIQVDIKDITEVVPAPFEHRDIIQFED